MQNRKRNSNFFKGMGEVQSSIYVSRFALILFCSFISFQVFFFNGLTGSNLVGHQALNIFSAKGRTDKSISAEIPLQSWQSSQLIDAEVEPTEDDIQHTLTESNHHPAQQFQLGEFIYTSSIKSRYLRLTSSVYKQARVPYFVLYHSWKNFIA